MRQIGGLFRRHSHLRDNAFRHPHTLAVDNPDLTVDGVSDLARGKRKPRLVSVTASHPCIGILKNLIGHANPPPCSHQSVTFPRRMTLTLTEMLIQREKNVKASFRPKDQDR